MGFRASEGLRLESGPALASWLPLLFTTALVPPLLAGEPGCYASAEIEHSLLLNPSASTYNAKGEYLAGRGDAPCAIQAFRKAIEFDGRSWQPHFNLALEHLRKGQTNEALPHLERAAALRPESLDARLAFGSALAGTGQSDRAARELGAAVQIDPDSLTARHRLARVLLSQRRYAAAIMHLEQALERRPADPDSRLLLGQAHSNVGDPERAIQALRKLVEVDSGHFLGHYNLAAAYAQTDLYEEAAKHFRMAMRLDPGHLLARLSAAKAEVNLNRHQQALDLTQVWSELIPASLNAFEVLHLRGIALRGLGRLKDAKAALRRAVALRHGHADAQRNLGLILARLQEYEEARQHLERARELNPDSREIRFELIAVLRELEDPAALERELASFEEQKRQSQSEGMAARAAARGDAYRRTGDPEAALREYRQQFRYNPEDARLQYAMALALSALGRHGERMEALGQALALDPGLAEAHNELGIALTAQGRDADAEAALKAAIEARPQYAAPRGNLGVLYARQGRHVEAEALFRRAVEDDPRTAHLRVNHGLTLAALSRFAEAREAFRRAMALDPKDPKVDQALRMLERLRDGRTPRTP